MPAQMMPQLLKFTTREGSKAANGSSLFRIEHVILVTSLHDSVSKRKEQQKREKKKAPSFEHALQQACEDTQQKEISYSASGYTKTGLAYHHVEKRREYVH